MYKFACGVVDKQDGNLKRINNTRFVIDGYEYRLTYKGGFTAYIAIDRRKVGTRNFKYFGGYGAYNCWSVEEAVNGVKQYIKGKVM